MADGRILAKRISRSSKVAALSSDTVRMVYTWLIPYLDVEGRMEADVDLIKADVAPRLKHITPQVLERILDELHKIGLVILYNVNGTRYLQLVKFDENQPNLRKDREAPSKIPAPPEHSGSGLGQTPEGVRSNSGVEPEEVRAKLSKEKLSKENTIAWSDEARAFIGIQAEDRVLWSKAYPAVNLDQEIAKAASWVISNPKNKKSNWPRFLNGWLKKAQDQAPARGPGNGSGIVPPKPKKPAKICDRCHSRVFETVEYRQQQLCESCIKTVNPEMAQEVRERLQGIGKPI